MKTNKHYSFQAICLASQAGIADKTPFSEIMCNSFEIDKHKCLLDVGCGSGIIGIYALLNHIPFVYFNDIQQDAITLTKKNLSRYHIESERYHLIEGSFSQIDLSKYQVDAITFNPPQLPTDIVDITTFREENERVFRDGGKNGWKLIIDFFVWLSGQNIHNISIYLGISSMLKIDLLIAEIQKNYHFSAIKKHKKVVPLRKIFHQYIDTLSATERNEREIELIEDQYYKKIYVLQFKQ